MTDPARWLDARPEQAPPTLRAAVDERLAGTDATAPLHERFADAAIRALEAVLSEPSQRRTAQTLLAADALLTYACEAAAEAGLDELDRLTRALDFDRFDRLMPGAS